MIMDSLPLHIITIAIAMLAIDYVYLQTMKGYFKWQVETVQGSSMKINLWGAALCYLFLVAGIYYFILKPKRSYLDAFLLGLVIYGVYETTSYALLRDWAFSTVLIDTIWGGILFVLTTMVFRALF